MSDLEINYLRQQEDRRHNLTQEGISERELQERNRSNLVNEGLQAREVAAKEKTADAEYEYKTKRAKREDAETAFAKEKTRTQMWVTAQEQGSAIKQQMESPFWSSNARIASQSMQAGLVGQQISNAVNPISAFAKYTKPIYNLVR